MIVFFFLALTLGPPRGAPLTGPALEQRTYEIASLLRCPVCQGMSVADSPSTVALDMKRQVREMLERGYTQEQILSYFEESYGQFVLLKPKNRLIWILPVVLLTVGTIVVVATAKRLSTQPSADRPAQPADPYVDRVRELVERR